MPMYYKPLNHGALVFTAPTTEMALEQAARLAPDDPDDVCPLVLMPDPAYVTNDQGFEFDEAHEPGPPGPEAPGGPYLLDPGKGGQG